MKKEFFRILIVVFLSILYTEVFTNNIFASENKKVGDEHKNFTICIDAGHQSKADFKQEPISPGSSVKKARVSAGTKGVATNRAEYEVNLEASILLKNLFINKGYNVIMTRETHEVNISNAERAEIANNSKANIAIRIHCDSFKDPGKTGATILIPDKQNKQIASIYEDSNRFAQILKDDLKTSGIKVNGVFERKDITGFNWSKVPVVILEMGFMSNYNEDKMLSDPNYQLKLMEAVCKAVEQFKDVKTNIN